MESTASAEKIKESAKEEAKTETEAEIIADLFKKYKTDLIAFVDGSYNTEKNLAGAGIVILNENGIVLKKSLLPENPSDEALAMRNVFGEITAAKDAALYALNLRKSIIKMKKKQRFKFSSLKRLAELINKHTPDHPHFSMKAIFLDIKESGFSEDVIKLDLYVDR